MKVFISYSSASGTNHLIKRFSERLNESLMTISGNKKDSIVFIDYAIREGSNWKSIIESELNDTTVFISLLAPAYYASEYTSLELGLFINRLEKSKINSQSKTIPLITIPWQSSPMSKRDNLGYSPPPASGSAIFDGLQYKNKGEEKYGFYSFSDIAKKGFDYFLKQENNKEFDPVIDAFFIHLSEIIEESHSKWSTLIEKSRSNFSEVGEKIKFITANDGSTNNHETASKITSGRGGPRTHFIIIAAKPEEIKEIKDFELDEAAYLYEGGIDWRPFWPDGKYIGRCIQNILVNSTPDTEARIVGTSNLDYAIDIIKNAEKFFQPVFIIVDAWTARLPKYAAMIEEISDRNLPYCAIVVPFNAVETREDVVDEIHDLLSRREELDDPICQTHIAGNEYELSNAITDLNEKIKAKYRRRPRQLKPGTTNTPFKNGTKPIIIT